MFSCVFVGRGRVVVILVSFVDVVSVSSRRFCFGGFLTRGSRFAFSVFFFELCGRAFVYRTISSLREGRRFGFSDRCV